MKTPFALTATVAVALVPAGAAAVDTHSARPHKTLCVSSKRSCFHGLRAALKSAKRGDTIRLAAGTFPGGATVRVSVKIIGAGSAKTILSGGHPVLTIGVRGAMTEPTVSIAGVTITGGVQTSIGAVSKGGGIEIPAAAGGSTGATVTIRNSVITGNRHTPATSAPLGPPCPGDRRCEFAGGFGGGIANAGTLTLIGVTVSDNLVGGALASDAEGAGILSERGNLTLRHSVVSGNHATAGEPNGRFADGGGIFLRSGRLTMKNSRVTDNVAELTNAFPNSVETLAVAGGVHVTEEATATIRGTTISGNSVSSVNSVGSAAAFSAGLHADGAVTLHDVTISGNRAAATTPSSSAADAFADSGAGEINGAAAIDNSRFTGNSVTATAPGGTAVASAGAFVSAANPRTTISNSLVSGNSVTATSTTGTVIVQGAGIVNLGLLTLQNSRVENNAGTATGPAGVALGGGIWNGAFPGSPMLQLTLVGTRVTGNALSASPGVTVLGGGLYTERPVTLRTSVISGNSPDQCYGC